MLVTLNDQTYRLTFSHWDAPAGLRWQKETTCRIDVKNGEQSSTGHPIWHPMVDAVALCSVHDVFTKERGRKLALARALKLLPLTKSERLEFWSVYLNRRGPQAIQIEFLPEQRGGRPDPDPEPESDDDTAAIMLES